MLPWMTVLAMLPVTFVNAEGDEQTVNVDFRVAKGQRQLFLDDHGIARIENLKRTMHRPQKRGAVLRSPDPAQTVQVRTAPVWDPDSKLFKLWVHGLDNRFWVSQDGLHWSPGPRPNIGLSLAVYDPLDPEPSRRFKGIRPNRSFLVSPDGFTWTELDVPRIQSGDESNFSYDPRHGLFIHTVKRGGPYGRAVAIATSRDFQTWKDYGVVFHADELDQEMGRKNIEARRANPALKQTEYNTPAHYSVQIYNMGVFHYEGLYIGMPSMYHLTGKVPKDWPGFDNMHLSPEILKLVRKHGDYTGFYHIQLVCSRDLVNWNRLGDREPFIEASPLGAGAYDVQSIIGPSAPVIRGNELWFYYTGIKNYAFIGSGSDFGYDDYAPDAGAVCLAVLRRDGFISLDAGRQEGFLTTKPFSLGGDTLFVNVAVHQDGRLLAEVLDKNGQAAATSVPIKRGQAPIEVNWEHGDITNLIGQVVSLRFTLRNASLYSYWWNAEET